MIAVPALASPKRVCDFLWEAKNEYLHKRSIRVNRKDEQMAKKDKITACQEEARLASLLHHYC